MYVYHALRFSVESDELVGHSGRGQDAEVGEQERDVLG